MSTFSYEIITKEGKTKKGTIEADTYDKAKILVKKDAQTIVSLSEASALNKEITIGKKRASARDLSIFCRQFYSIMKAGVGVVECLEMLEQQTSNKNLAKSINETRLNVQKGDTLATAMRKQEIFPYMLTSMVAAGEQSGSLEKALFRMAEHFEKENRLKGLVKKAMIYPSVLITVALGVMILMIVKVIPSFMETFADADLEMPAFTLGVMAVSDFLIANWMMILIVIAAIVIVYNIYAKTPQGKRAIARLFLKIPVFGNLNVKTACARFTRTLSTLLASGMALTDSLEITSKTIDNVVYEDAILETEDRIKGGSNLSRPLKATNLFPAMVVHMIGIGEETGNLEEMLDNVADYYDEEVTIATEQLTALMEPLIILLLAVIVIVIIAAVYGPILTLYDGL